MQSTQKTTQRLQNIDTIRNLLCILCAKLCILCVKQNSGKISISKIIMTGMLFFQFCIPAFSQANEIIILEKGSSLPVSFANVHIQTLNKGDNIKCITDKYGKITNPFKDTVVISINALGYKNYSDTATLFEKTVLYLEPYYYDLDKVIISGQFRPQPMKASIYNIEVIEKKTIDRVGANNLGQVLNNNLKFQYRPEGVLGNFIRINGLTGEHVKILIDDMPVTGRQTSIIDLDQLSTHNVKRIEIINGPSSVIYGSNALAGVINIITDNYSGNKLTINSNSYYESVGIYNFNAAFAIKKANQIFSLNTGRNFHSGYNEEVSTRFSIWKPKLQYLAGVGYSFRKNNFLINYKSDFIHEELRDMDSLILEPLDVYHFTRRWNHRLNVSNSNRNKTYFKTQFGYSHYWKSKLTYINDRFNQTRFISPVSDLNDTTVFHLLFTRGFHSNKLSHKYEYQIGYDINYELADGKRIGGSHSLGDFAAFLNFIYVPFENANIQPGIRYNLNTKYNSAIIYALNLKWGTEKFKFLGSYGKGFRNPSLKELYYEFIDQIHEIYGNENLKAETANHISFSGEYQFKIKNSGFRIYSELFYNTLKNKIDLAYDVESHITGTYFNISERNFKTTGTEIELHYNYLPAMSLSGGANLVGRSSIKDLKAFLFTTDYSLSANYTNRKYNFEINLLYKYVDDFIEYHYKGSLDEIEEAWMNNYQNMDIAILKNFWENRIIVTAGVKNIFNNVLINSMGNISVHGSSDNNTIVGWGRTFFIKLSLKISK